MTSDYNFPLEVNINSSMPLDFLLGNDNFFLLNIYDILSSELKSVYGSSSPVIVPIGSDHGSWKKGLYSLVSFKFTDQELVDSSDYGTFFSDKLKELVRQITLDTSSESWAIHISSDKFYTLEEDTFVFKHFIRLRYRIVKVFEKEEPLF